MWDVVGQCIQIVDTGQNSRNHFSNLTHRDSKDGTSPNITLANPAEK